MPPQTNDNTLVVEPGSSTPLMSGAAAAAAPSSDETKDAVWTVAADDEAPRAASSEIPTEVIKPHNDDDVGTIGGDEERLDESLEETQSTSSGTISEKGEEEDDDDDDDEDDEQSEPSAHDLIGQAKNRLALQQLMEQVEKLQNSIETKNVELENMAGHLRRAETTKEQLCQAHAILEKRLGTFEQQQELHAKQAKKTNFDQQESRAEIELEFMNEIAQLRHEMDRRQAEHEHELATVRSLHADEMVHKDRKIAQVMNKLRQIREAHEKARQEGSGQYEFDLGEISLQGYNLEQLHAEELQRRDDRIAALDAQLRRQQQRDESTAMMMKGNFKAAFSQFRSQKQA